MNGAPHSHGLYVSDYGSYWHIMYGDQTGIPSKPWRWRFWENDEQYERRSAKRLRHHIKQMVKTHDRASKRAALAASFDLPQLRRDQWGSDQL